ASKRAVLGYCEAMQYDLWQLGSEVKISVVCPNKMATDMPNSARNRPAELAGRVPTPEDLERMAAYLADGGHTPDQAAKLVLDGIAEQRFYILTNPKDAEQTVAWAAGVQAGQLMQPKLDQVDLDH